MTLVESVEAHYFYATKAACIGSKLLFSRTTADSGNEPWISDGTVAGTKLLKDIHPGPTGSRRGGDAEMASIGGVAVFQADDNDAKKPTIWVTDGTPAGTRKLGAHGATVDGSWYALGTVGRRLYLGKYSAPEVVWTDGTTTGVIALGGKPWPAANSWWMTSGSRLFGFGYSPATSNEPWMLDDPDALLPPAALPDGGQGGEPGGGPAVDGGAGDIGGTGAAAGGGGGDDRDGGGEDPTASAPAEGESGGCAVHASGTRVARSFGSFGSLVAVALAVARRRRRAGGI